MQLKHIVFNCRSHLLEGSFNEFKLNGFYRVVICKISLIIANITINSSGRIKKGPVYIYR